MPTARTLNHLYQLQRELHERLQGVDECIHRIAALFKDIDEDLPALTEDWEGLVNSNEAMRILSVSSTTLNRYRSGNYPAGRAAFPTPVKYKGRSPYWHRDDLIRWCST